MQIKFNKIKAKNLKRKIAKQCKVLNEIKQLNKIKKVEIEKLIQ